MMFKAAILATVFAVAACQQAVQQYTSSPFYNVFPKGQQYFDYYNGQYQGFFPFNGIKHFKQYPYISLVNNQNQPLGYFYWVNSDAVLQQPHYFIPVRDNYGNLFGYYSYNQYKPGQQFQPQILNENVISQLGHFGFIYNQPSQEKFGFIVVKSPYVFHYHENGVLKPSTFQNTGFTFQFPYNFYGPNYYGQYQYPQQYYYGQQYQGQYFPRYQGQYYPFFKFPFNYNQYTPAY